MQAAPPGHSMNVPAEIASLRTKYDDDSRGGRGSVEERVLRRVPGEHGGPHRWRSACPGRDG